MLPTTGTKMVLDQVAYEREARGIKSLKISSLSRCNEGIIMYEPVKNPYRTGCGVPNRQCQLKFPQIQGRVVKLHT